MLPADAAPRTTPWLDVLVSAYVFEGRYDDPFNPGLQVGVYLSKMVRLAGRLVLPIGDTEDQTSIFSLNYVTLASDPPSLLYGASAGVIAVGTRTFVMSPGLILMRADVADYGSFLGVSIPLEWVTGNGLRIGLEFGLGRAFGGAVRQRCDDTSDPPSCETGSEREIDRGDGTGFYLQFQMGFGFNHPKEEQPP
jgi:hypothetical protein